MDLWPRVAQRVALLWLGFEAPNAGDHELATARFRATALTEALGPIRAGGLDGLAEVACERDPERTLRLIAAATALRERHGGRPPPFVKRRAESVRRRAEQQLDRAQTSEGARGLQMSTEDAVALAVQVVPPLPI